MNKLFKYKDKKIIYIGDNDLECIIPERYSNYNLLTFDDNKVMSLGIFDMNIGDILFGIILPTIVTMEPSNFRKITIDSKVYYKLIFNSNSVFLTNTEFVKYPFIGYATFVEFISMGNIPKFIKYNDMATLFDIIGEYCSLKFDFNHVIFEMLFAHLSRNKNDLNIQHRLAINDKFKLIKPSDLSYSTDSTTAKLLGNYLSDGINSSLVTEQTESHELEIYLKL